MNNEVFSMRKFLPMLSAALVLGVGFTPAADAFTLSVVPQTSTVSAGGTLSVDVVASDLGTGVAPSIGAYDLDLNFDPAVLAFANVVWGSGLSVTGIASDSGTQLETDFVNVFELSWEDTVDLNSLQADAFTLFTITFDALNAGTSLLSLHVNAVSAAEGAALFADALNGASVSVTGAPAVPLPAGVWLLLSGLAGAGVFSRRRA
jgi:hypothetical protein